MSVVFDKLSFVRRLEGEGAFTRPQAETLSDAFHQAINESVATKEDVDAVRRSQDLMRVELTGEAMTLRAELKGELTALRSELKGDMATLESELRGGMAGLRSEMKAEMAGLGSEMKADMAALRSELKGDMAALRSELKVETAGVRAAIADGRVWTVSVGASIVAVLAAIKYFG